MLSAHNAYKLPTATKCFWYEQQLFRILVVTELCSYSNPFKFRYACGDGYLKVYTKGQEEKYHYDKHDYEFCGTATPPVVKTEGPRLVLLFKVRNIFGFFLKRMHIRWMKERATEFKQLPSVFYCSSKKSIQISNRPLKKEFIFMMNHLKRNENS